MKHQRTIKVDVGLLLSAAQEFDESHSTGYIDLDTGNIVFEYRSPGEARDAIGADDATDEHGDTVAQRLREPGRWAEIPRYFTASARGSEDEWIADLTRRMSERYGIVIEAE